MPSAMPCPGSTRSVRRQNPVCIHGVHLRPWLYCGPWKLGSTKPPCDQTESWETIGLKCRQRCSVDERASRTCQAKSTKFATVTSSRHLFECPPGNCYLFQNEQTPTGAAVGVASSTTGSSSAAAVTAAAEPAVLSVPAVLSIPAVLAAARPEEVVVVVEQQQQQ